jgi:hypothetical protein
LIVVGMVSSSTKESHLAGSAPKVSVSSAPTVAPDTTDNEWALIESTNKMDNTPEVVLLKSGSNGSSMTIRCTEHKTYVYVDTDTVVDNGAIRVRFDQSSPVRQRWERSTDYKALFAPDAIAFSRQLAKARTFLFEFTPFQEGARALAFDVSGLDAKLPKISNACDWEAVDKGRARAKTADAALRERISHYVHQCDRSGAYPGQWCWSDPNDAVFHNETPAATKEAALDDAVRTAKMGLAFKKQSNE